MAETVVPTDHTIIEGAVNDPELAYDGKNFTFAEVFANSAGSDSIIDVHTFAADLTPEQRVTATLSIRGQWQATDDFDVVRIGVSDDAGANFTMVDEQTSPDGWTTSVSITREFEIISVITFTPTTDTQIRVQFANGSAGVPPPDFQG